MNDEIERLRHSATAALLSRRDVLIVASVSCIYGLGSPEQYEGSSCAPVRGTDLDGVRDAAPRRHQYQRNNVSRARGTFRVQGDTLEVFPTYEQVGYRVEWWGETIERISRFDPLTGLLTDTITDLTTASHYVASDEQMERALVAIEEELHERLAELESQSKLLEAERLRMRTTYDLEMLREVGFCSGIENYSRHIDGRAAGRPRSSITLPGRLPRRDRRVARDGAAAPRDVRRRHLAEVHPRRLPVPPAERDRQPSAPIRGVPGAVHQIVYMSATPGPWELKVSRGSWNRSSGPPA